MANVVCPKCAHEAPADVACPKCGQSRGNGVQPPAPQRRENPPPPPEVSTWVMYPTPPEIIEEFRRTFNEAEFIAELREVERTGGVRFEEIIEEIERRVNGSA